MLEKDLKFAFYNIKTIRAGEKFIVYEEINHSYSILDFCMIIDELDIKLTITDLTEGRIIFSKEGIDKLIYSPLKIMLFFSNPRILKFEFDNSYSWFTSKTIKYKINILYPNNPYLLAHQILISKYQNTIIKGKKMKKEKNKKKTQNKTEVIDYNKMENLLIIKIDGENKVFNCTNVKENLVEINKMVKDNYLNISSIYIELKQKKEEIDNKTFFYYNKNNQGFNQNELTKEVFEKYLHDLIKKSKANLNIINLYIINGDLNDDDNNVNGFNKYYYSIKKLLGFEPVIKIEGIMQKIIFFIQYLNQSQILYYLYKQINQEQINCLLLINYTKYGGYQMALYNDEEILAKSNEFKGLNKNKSLEQNVEIICDGIKEIIEGEKKIDIILTQSVDDSEKNITPEKIEEKLNEKIKLNKNNYRIIKPGLKFNKELLINSHVFYLDN